MHHKQPTTTFPIAIGMPEIRIQNMFAIRLMVPPPYTTSLPNGQNASPANLKHCTPIGIPIMVMHHKQPAIIHANPLNKPPNINHNMFPNNFILPILISHRYFFSMNHFMLDILSKHSIYYNICYVNNLVFFYDIINSINSLELRQIRFTFNQYHIMEFPGMDIFKSSNLLTGTYVFHNIR